MGGNPGRGNKITALQVEKASGQEERRRRIRNWIFQRKWRRLRQSPAAVRKIFFSPSFTQKLSDLQQLPDYDGKFLAKIAGLPKPTVCWTFNDEEIVKSDKYKIKRDGDICVLFVRDCTPERAGRYACILTNSEGNFVSIKVS